MLYFLLYHICMSLMTLDNNVAANESCISFHWNGINRRINSYNLISVVETRQRKTSPPDFAWFSSLFKKRVPFNLLSLNDDISPRIHFYEKQQIYLDWGMIGESTHVISVYSSRIFWKIEKHSFSFFSILVFIFNFNQNKNIWSCNTQKCTSIIENCNKIQ